MSSKVKSYVLLLLISIIWGSQFLFNRFALEDFSSLWVATGRSIIGCLTLIVMGLFIKKAGHTTGSKLKYWSYCFLIGFFEASLPFSLIAWGQQHVSSSLAAIMVGTVPIFTAFLTAVCIRNEKVHLGTIVAVVLGFIGIVLLLLPQGGVAIDLLYQQAKGEIAILGGAISFAISLVLIKFLPSRSPVFAARDILMMASLQLLIMAGAVHSPFPTTISAESGASLLALGVLCAGVVYLFYVKLIHLAGASFASFSNYLVPVVGVVIGILLLNNSLSSREILALGTIVLGFVVNEWLSKNTHKS